MKREDLRNKIIPTVIDNTDNIQNTGGKEFNTTDLIYLDSFDEQKNVIEKRVFATDYAQMNNAYICYEDTYNDKPLSCVWLRSAFNRTMVRYIDGFGECFYTTTGDRRYGICPSLHYKLPVDSSPKGILRFFKKYQNKEEGKENEFDIRKEKKIGEKNIYHTLQLGEYPKTKLDDDFSQLLESLYNGGKIKEGLLCTGRWYSTNGVKDSYKDYAGKHSPEFEYQGKRYVRVVSYPQCKQDKYSDGTIAGKPGTIRWVRVEPISFEIKNWKEMPKSINPKGNGKAKYFDLRAKETITSNIPFYPEEDDTNSTMWQNSTIRGFLNGIDVRNVKSNGNIDYGASHGGNFTGECNFLNEAFNLSREPMIEYTIPNSEKEIPEDSFNGCITLKKIIIHSGIKSIGKKSFDGLDLKYVYDTPNGELVLAQELPKNKEEYINIAEISKIAQPFDEFDYNILIQKNKLGNVIEFSNVLNKYKFCVPCSYALLLIENGKEKTFYEDSDFRFFKNEIPTINNMLCKIPEKEKAEFFKFANTLGCFSKEKILDKNGKETEVMLAQKASSLLAQILKTEKMQLRKIS